MTARFGSKGRTADLLRAACDSSSDVLEGAVALSADTEGGGGGGRAVGFARASTSCVTNAHSTCALTSMPSPVSHSPLPLGRHFVGRWCLCVREREKISGFVDEEKVGSGFSNRGVWEEETGRGVAGTDRKAQLTPTRHVPHKPRTDTGVCDRLGGRERYINDP
ncbi:hypothetical protein chiPu_0011462 [Chiloscyllium punctatum]|uniref:Uncharacterized protein n=1 Tax=Chiloscyllium punctatum TaxID=137246 RepID=A0A401SRJ2_CHIPU|nr:hypothetical protein [Chiloscyllium punctatum]